MTIKATNLKFIAGKTYTTRSICDSDTIFSYEIVSRTNKTMMIKHSGKTFKRGIYIMDGEEYCRPDGTFSMCPVIRASSLTTDAEPDSNVIKLTKPTQDNVEAVKRVIGTIDLTPTWVEQMRIAAHALMLTTNDEARRNAMLEMERCGQLADLHVQAERARKQQA